MKSSNHGFFLIAVSFAIASTLSETSAFAADDKADPTVSLPLSLAEPLPAEALTAPELAVGRLNGGDVLDRLSDSFQHKSDWKRLAREQQLRIEGNSVLVEVRMKPGARRNASSRLAASTGLRVHAQNVPNLFDAWLPLDAVKALRANAEVFHVRPARHVRTLDAGANLRAGSVVTEGVTASGLDPYHALGADGSGTIVALIDSGFVGWDSLQGSGDWPTGANLRRFVVDGSNVIECPGPAACSSFDDPANGDHGTNTIEIAYDMAPGATYWVYQSTLISEWYAALDHASDSANHGGLRADVVSASLGAPLDGIGDGSACPAIWGSPCGTIAEASELARSRGTLVVNAAGNERRSHWGGQFLPSSGSSSIHAWDGAGQQINFIGDGAGLAFCIPDGFLLSADLHWDDWTNVDHDYDLELYEWDGSTWGFVTGSAEIQNGAGGQAPQEAIRLLANNTSDTTVCDASSGIYGFVIRNFSASTNRNLQFFGPFDLDRRIPERSLGFPADSPAVFTVGALNATGAFDVQSSFSSEGPVLAAGGGLPPPADFPKPDGMNFSFVSTVSAGPGNGTSSGFSGTSAATPHVAGIAAVLAQLRLEKPAQTATNPAEALHNGLARIGLDGDNDLGTAEHDTLFGYGRIRLRACSKTFNITADVWHQVALPCDRRAGNTIAETFGTLGLGTYGTDWILSRWDPIAGSYGHLAATDSLNVADSYWLYSFNPGSGTLTGLVPDLTEAWPMDAVGASGFGRPYMTSNPRTFSMDWDRVRFHYNGVEHDFAQAVNDGRIRSMMWLWDPGTETFNEFNGLLGEGQLQPGQAFWLRALDDVQVRYPTTAAASILEANRRPSVEQQAAWSVTVHLETATDYAAVRFGQHPDASNGFDAYDAERLAPPSAADTVMVIPRADLGEFNADYVRDFRQPSRRDEWRIEIRSPGGPAVLRWDDPTGALARSWLIDESNGKRIPLWQSSGSLRLRLEPGTHTLRWDYRRAGPLHPIRPFVPN